LARLLLPELLGRLGVLAGTDEVFVAAVVVVVDAV
jgi:hypothetical protein